MSNSLMDVWCDIEPKVCRVNPKGYRLKFEDYMPVLIGETATGISAILGVVMYLCRKRELYGEIDDYTTEDAIDLEKDAAALLRRYLLAVDENADEVKLAKLPLFEPDGVS